MTHTASVAETGRLFKSSLWSVFSRWFVKLIGLVSTIFIIRLLMPEDYGIVMKAILVFGPLAMVSNIGFFESIIRIKNPTKEHYDTIFTANVILSFVLAIILYLTSPIFAYIFKEELLKVLLSILAIKILLTGFINPRIQDFLKDFEYSNDFKFLVYSKIINATVTLICCFYFRNYYGLIMGQTIGIIGTIIVSYCMINYKPAFSLKYIKDCADFSFPNMRAGVGDYVLMNMDRLLLSRFINNNILGFYNIAYELAEQFTTEVIYPLARGFFPIFADLEHDKEKLKATYLEGISFLMPVCLAIGLGLSFVAHPLIVTYAGEKWELSSDILKILAISSASQAFCLVNSSVLGATGKIKLRAKLTNSNVIVSIILILPFAIQGDIINVLLIKALISIIFVFINLLIITKSLEIKISDVVSRCLRPIMASICMIFLLKNIDITNPYLELFVMVTSGSVLFITVQFGMWIISGMPETIEYSVLKKLGVIRSHD